MFREAQGLKAHCGELTLMVSADFDEWRIIVQGPDVVINGGRQFTETRAKEDASAIAESYLHEKKGQDAPFQDIAWVPLEPGEWLNWRR